VTRRTFEKKNFLENSKKRKNPENATDKIFTEIKTPFWGFFYVHSRSKNNSGESHQINKQGEPEAIINLQGSSNTK